MCEAKRFRGGDGWNRVGIKRAKAILALTLGELSFSGPCRHRMSEKTGRTEGALFIAGQRNENRCDTFCRTREGRGACQAPFLGRTFGLLDRATIRLRLEQLRLFSCVKLWCSGRWRPDGKRRTPRAAPTQANPGCKTLSTPKLRQTHVPASRNIDDDDDGKNTHRITGESTP